MKNKLRHQKGQSFLEFLMMMSTFLALLLFILSALGGGLTGYFKTTASSAAQGDFAEAGADAGSTSNTSTRRYSLSNDNGWDLQDFGVNAKVEGGPLNTSSEIKDYEVKFKD